MSEESNTTDGTFEQLTGATMHYMSVLNSCVECHGCSGKGWVENTKGEIKLCPVCEGKGKLNKEKDCVEKEKRDNLPWYPWYPYYLYYPYPSRTDDPCWPTYPIVTYCEAKTDSCTSCSRQE